MPSVPALAGGAVCPAFFPSFRPAPPFLQGLDWPMALLIVLLLLALLLALFLIMLRPVPWRFRLPGGVWGEKAPSPEAGPS